MSAIGKVLLNEEGVYKTVLDVYYTLVEENSPEAASTKKEADEGL